MEKIKISIVVPIYNIEQFLPKCIESIIEQTYENIEIILVNDGTKDSSGEICKDYASKDNRIVYLEKENGGLSSARNYGMQHMHGDYVWFVDGDDYIESNAVEVLVEILKKYHYDVLSFSYYKVKNSICTPIRFKYAHLDLSNTTEFVLELPMAWGKIYCSELLLNNQLQFKEGIYYEDLALIPGLVNYTNKIGFLDKPLYYYVQREGSIMHHQVYNQKIETKYKALESFRNMFELNGNFDKYREEIEFIHIKHLLVIYSIDVMKYGRKIYKPRINKALNEMKTIFPQWTKNKYLAMEPFYTKVYLFLLRNHFYFTASFMNFVARKIL